MYSLLVACQTETPRVADARGVIAADAHLHGACVDFIAVKIAPCGVTRCRAGRVHVDPSDDARVVAANCPGGVSNLQASLDPRAEATRTLLPPGDRINPNRREARSAVLKRRARAGIKSPAYRAY